MSKVQTYHGTVQFDDLGAGVFYLVVDEHTRYRLVFDYSKHDLYAKLRKLASSVTTVLHTVSGTLDKNPILADPGDVVYALDLDGVL